MDSRYLHLHPPALPEKTLIVPLLLHSKLNPPTNKKMKMEHRDDTPNAAADPSSTDSNSDEAEKQHVTSAICTITYPTVPSRLSDEDE